MSRKVFTAGEVLAAADVNSFLMDQTVMSFAGTAARGSAIPSPVTGMYTHLEDARPRQEFWNGSAWVSPFGATLVSESVFTSASDVSISNVFTSAFQNYSIYVNVQSVSVGGNLVARLLLAGTPASTNYYYAGVTSYTNISTIDSVRGHPGTFFFLVNTLGTEDAYGTIDIFSPNQARDTTMRFAFGGGTGSNYTNSAGSCLHSATTAYDGIQFFNTGGGNLTGTIRIYGMRNS